MFVRTIGIDRAIIKIGMANPVYNFSRLVCLQGHTSPARAEKRSAPNRPPYRLCSRRFREFLEVSIRYIL
jgi:hypothetical protein